MYMYIHIIIYLYTYIVYIYNYIYNGQINIYIICTSTDFADPCVCTTNALCALNLSSFSTAPELWQLT